MEQKGNKLPNIRLQNLRDFTVQIRRPSDDAIVGTGIAVSMDGQVVTCAHVVRAAGHGEIAVWLASGRSPGAEHWPGCLLEVLPALALLAVGWPNGEWRRPHD